MTTRLSMALTAFGAVQLMFGRLIHGQEVEFPGVFKCVVEYRPLPRNRFRGSGLPSSLRASCSRTLRTVDATSSVVADMVFLASQANARPISFGLSVFRSLVLKAQPVMALRSTASSGLPRSVDSMAKVAVASVSALPARDFAAARGHFMST